MESTTKDDDGSSPPRLPRWLQIVFSFVALALLVARMIRPNLNVDAISLGLLILVILPWVIDSISSLELPGGAKITFKQFAQAVEKVIGKRQMGEPLSKEPTPGGAQYLASIEDPNLILAGIRIEIERRARRLASNVGVSGDVTLARLLRELNRKGTIPDQVFSGLGELVGLGNLAAHGNKVERETAEWARVMAPQVFELLDGYIAESEKHQ